MEKIKPKLIPVLIFLVAFAYYAVLSCKEYTFLFVSQDSGDWLAASTWWMTPQPVGSPLYILLGHFLNLFGGSLPAKMTLILSAFPSAVTVTLVYLIVHKFTQNKWYGLVASAVLLGASVFLSQSTILEEYALTMMLVMLAYWFYINDKKKLTLLALGIGTSVHIMVLLITVLWWIVERKNWFQWLKLAWIYIIPVIAFYSLIPILMEYGQPMIGGTFSWHNLYHYVSDTPSSVGYNISIADFPERLLKFTGTCAMCLGLAWIPVFTGLHKKMELWQWIALSTAIFSLTYYLFSIDPSTWAFLIFGLPFLAILAGVGLSALRKAHVQLVLASCLCLIVANSLFLNASVLADKEPIATTIESEMKALPPNSAVIVMQGHYSLCMFYVMAQGRSDLIPILWVEDMGEFPQANDMSTMYWGYYRYYLENKGISSLLPIDRVQECYDKGYPLYIAGAPWMLDKGVNEPWTYLVKSVLTMEGDGRIRHITGVDYSIPSAVGVLP